MENEIQEHTESQKREHKLKNRSLFNRFILISFFIISVSLSFYFGFMRGKGSAPLESASPLEKTLFINRENSKNYFVDFSLFWKVMDLLKEKYVDTNTLDANKLFYGAIKGMLAATGDPYTNFFDPVENKKFREEIQGSFEGIGAQVGIKNGVLTIIAPLKDYPADKAGLRAGDKVLKIDGKDTQDMMVDQAVDLMRGPKGTEVKLTVFREGNDGTEEITIKRDIIKVKSVELEMKDNGIAHVKITQFGEKTYSEFSAIARKLSEDEVKSIVLDLRNDPGGYLDACVDIASKMIPRGKTVVIEESRDKKQTSLYTKGGDVLSQKRTIVLINQGSASASEILAGALRDDRDNVTVLGETSFGKGSVQTFEELPGGSAIKITVAKWLTPKGEQINEKGIKPDIEVKLTNDDYENNRDPQLDKALELLNEQK